MVDFVYATNTGKHFKFQVLNLFEFSKKKPSNKVRNSSELTSHRYQSDVNPAFLLWSLNKYLSNWNAFSLIIIPVFIIVANNVAKNSRGYEKETRAVMG